jgi:PhzF family phenazine biosynthesis protein
MRRRFNQIDVFTGTAYYGNPVAVVLDGEGLGDEQMQRFAAWMNLSETTFLTPPATATGDYGVRIFTPVSELPFAGHPTLGSCHAWLEAGGISREPDVIVQECKAGQVRIQRIDDRLAFAAPPLIRSGPVDEPTIAHIAQLMAIDRAKVLDAEWADNGPGWAAIWLESAEAVLALRPGLIDMDVGVVGPYPLGSAEAIEVRAFFPANGGIPLEDPVTGSLNAALAPWLLRTGRVTSPYIVRQGTALGRAGQVHVRQDPDGTVWVGGGTITAIEGTVEL